MSYIDGAPQRGNKRTAQGFLPTIPCLNLFPLIINNKNFILQPPREGGLDKGLFMLYICSRNRSFFYR